MLVPGQARAVLGTELLVAGLLAWSILVVIHVRGARSDWASRAVLVGRIVMAQIAMLPFMVAGMSLLLRAGGGLYWLVPGVVLCFGGRGAERVGAAHRDPAMGPSSGRSATTNPQGGARHGAERYD
jgi:hypothetical protein